MTFRVRNAGTLRTIDEMTLNQAGITRRISEAKVFDGGVLRTVATFTPPMSASTNPKSVSASSGSPFNAEVTTPSVTASPTGGEGPYTYAWTREGVNGTITSPSSATTTFKANVGPGSDFGSNFRCTITDKFGTKASATCSASFKNTYTGAGS